MKKIIFILLLFVFIGFSALFVLNSFEIEYDLTSIEDMTIEYTEKFISPNPIAYLKGKYILKDGVPLDVAVNSTVIEGKIGSYPIYYKTSFLHIEKEASSVCNIIDLDYPIIELKFLDEEYILPGEDYNSFSASDNYDGDITDKVIVDVGEDEVIYTVSDSYGNKTSVTKKLVTDKTKIIYLTFDDGPSPYTSELLDILKKHNVKATFFVVGTAYCDILSRVAEEGHTIGIHSYTHEFKYIYANDENYFADFNKIKDLIYQKSGYDTKLLRFPGGSSNTVSKRYNKGIMTRIAEELHNQGYEYFDWNVDSDDAGKARDSQTVYDNVIKGITGKRVAVVLQHDIKKFSVDAVEDIIIWGKENGYIFLPLRVDSFTAQHRILN